MDARAVYESWLSNPKLDDAFRAELTGLPEQEIRERFFAPLAFGTAGLRGIMGAGINRMNIYVVGQTTQAFAQVLLGKGPETAAKGVAISYDCRNNSALFARHAASVLAANGIPVFLFEAMRPTPELSFIIRARGCAAGINITASHNPKEYNGYKAYWSDGAQIDDAMAAEISAARETVDLFDGVKTVDVDAAIADGRITILGAETDEQFLQAAVSKQIDRELTKNSDVSIVYTPFHGTGYRLIPEAFRRAGLKKVYCVPEQMIPDGNFSTVKSPNPEEAEGFALAIGLARETGSDLIIASDPDADRIGLAVRNGAGEFVTLSGNQTGALLCDYLIRAMKAKNMLPDKCVIISTIVSSLLPRRICESNGVSYEETFTGFRFIAERLAKLEQEGYTFLMGFEESYGYMIGSHCRDKDAVTASLLVAEMAAYYEKQGMTLYDALQKLYASYGGYAEKTINLKFPGISGLETMAKLMTSLRNDPPAEIGGTRVAAVRDFLTGVRRTAAGETSPTALRGSNVLYYELADGCVLVIRPSGTEPKIKIYLLARAAERETALELVARYAAAAEKLAEA